MNYRAVCVDGSTFILYENSNYPNGDGISGDIVCNHNIQNSPTSQLDKYMYPNIKQNLWHNFNDKLSEFRQYTKYAQSRLGNLLKNKKINKFNYNELAPMFKESVVDWGKYTEGSRASCWLGSNCIGCPDENALNYVEGSEGCKSLYSDDCLSNYFIDNGYYLEETDDFPPYEEWPCHIKEYCGVYDNIYSCCKYEACGDWGASNFYCKDSDYWDENGNNGELNCYMCVHCNNPNNMDGCYVALNGCPGNKEGSLGWDNDIEFTNWEYCNLVAGGSYTGSGDSCGWDFSKSNCDLEPISGCTDEDACNYNPSADTSDGSCIYADGFTICDCSFFESSAHDGNGGFTTESFNSTTPPPGTPGSDGFICNEEDYANFDSINLDGILPPTNWSPLWWSGYSCPDSPINNNNGCRCWHDSPSGWGLQNPDCNNVCGGDAELDACGVCNGDNSDCGAVGGCQDPLACNYGCSSDLLPDNPEDCERDIFLDGCDCSNHPSPTYDDGSCFFPEIGKNCRGQCVANNWCCSPDPSAYNYCGKTEMSGACIESIMCTVYYSSDCCGDCCRIGHGPQSYCSDSCDDWDIGDYEFLMNEQGSTCYDANSSVCSSTGIGDKNCRCCKCRNLNLSEWDTPDPVCGLPMTFEAFDDADLLELNSYGGWTWNRWLNNCNYPGSVEFGPTSSPYSTSLSKPGDCPSACGLGT